MTINIANSREPSGGRYLVKAVDVVVFTQIGTGPSAYDTYDEAIWNAGQVSNNNILAKHSSCRCWHCPRQVHH